MDVVFLLPGIFGSRLASADNTLVWPPTVKEFIRKRYRRLDALMGDDVSPAGIIDDVSCCDVYGSLIRDLERIGYTSGGTQKRLVQFSYDWRKDIRVSSEQLARSIEETVANGAQRVFLVCHSMGGLVARHMLESGAHAGQDWIRAVSKLIALAVPHEGAPLALHRIRGEESSTGLSGEQIATLSKDPRYPSGYQLLPRPGAEYIRDVSASQVESRVVDAFSDEFVAEQELSSENIATAKSFWDEIGIDKRPEHCSYFFFASANRTTVTGFEKRGRFLQNIEQKDSGDETVPAFSASSMRAPTHFVRGEHRKIFKSLELRRTLYELLGAPPGVRPASTDGRDGGDELVEDIVLPREPAQPSQALSVSINFRESITSFEDTLVFEARRVIGADDVEGENMNFPIAYQGPALETLNIRINAPSAPGFYSVRLLGTLTDDSEPPMLVVHIP